MITIKDKEDILDKLREADENFCYNSDYVQSILRENRKNLVKILDELFHTSNKETKDMEDDEPRLLKYLEGLNERMSRLEAWRDAQIRKW